MATTTNYSWTTPDDTSLVKDGAAAIRSLGTAIDTTVFNNAGAAIAKTLIDAKGDLIVGSAADTVARLAAGTNGYLLSANSGATNGLEWVAAPTSGGTTLLQSLALSGSSVTSSTFSSAYTQILVYIKGMYINSGTVDCSLRLNGDTGSNYGYRWIRAESNNAVGSSASTAATAFDFGGCSNSSTPRLTSNGLITITRPSDTDQVFLAAQFQMYDGTGYRLYDSVGVYDGTAAITNLTIFQSQSFSGGTAEIYGVK